MGELIIFLVLLSLGLIVGTTTERRHIRKLDQREEDVSDMLVTQLKSYPEKISGHNAPQLFMGEVVVATDYLKSFLASIKNLFGGEMGSYLSLQTRARREATLRVVEQAKSNGYNAVCNMRFQSADIGGNTSSNSKKKVAMVAVLASGTAYHIEK